jgi:protein phosphatase
MADVQGLYIVTAGVLVGLFTWVLVVLARAPKALDESTHAQRPLPEKPKEAPPAAADPVTEVSPPAALDAGPATSAPGAPGEVVTKDRRRDATTVPDVARQAAAAASAVAAAATVVADPPSVVVEAATETVPAPAAPIPAAAPPIKEPLPPVVVLPPIRHRLDSHPEIQDSSLPPPVIVMPDANTSAAQAPLLALVTAVGRSEPDPGKTPERHAIVEQDHLFVFADGAGRKAGPDLVSGMAVEALTQAFAKDEASAFLDDPKLSARANRVRRAVLAANIALLKRARAMAFGGLGASAFVGHFSPKNDELFVARVGANRAYRLRGGELVRLTTSQAARQVGLVERVEVEVVTSPTQPDDLYLFCSEGLATILDDAALATALKVGSSLEDMTQRLIAALGGSKEGAKDQLAIVVRIDSSAPPPAKKPTRARTVLGLG